MSLAIKPISKALTFDVGHDVKQSRACFARGVNRDDVRMLEARSDFDFADEAFSTKPGRKLLVEYFDRDFSVWQLLASEVDARHPPAIEFADQCIAFGQRRLQAFKLRSHGAFLMKGRGYDPFKPGPPRPGSPGKSGGRGLWFLVIGFLAIELIHVAGALGERLGYAQIVALRAELDSLLEGVSTEPHHTESPQGIS